MRRLTFLLIGVHLGSINLWARDDHAAVQAVIARQEALQNVEVVYEIGESFSPPPEFREPIDQGAETLAFQTRPKIGEARFRYLSGRANYEWRNKQPMAGMEAHERLYRIQSFLGDRAEVAWKGKADSRDMGKISNHENLPNEAVIDLALGLREHGNSDAWLSPDVWNTFTVGRGDDGTLILKQSPAKSNGRRLDVWTFDPKLGYGLLRYEVFWDKQLSVELKNSDFRAVGELRLPFKTNWRGFFNSSGSDPVETRAKELRIKTYKLNDPGNTPNSYLITWPDGAVVLDTRTDNQIVVEGGPTKLDDGTLKQYAKGRSLSEDAGAARFRFWMIVGNGVLLIAVLAGFVLHRRYRRRNS
jgi:hypothetical protein